MNLAARFETWAAAPMSPRPLARFRRTFAAIWLVYDLLDITGGGTQRYLWIWRGETRSFAWGVAAAQAVLIACELGLVLGRWPRALVIGALLARALETSYFGVNDFYYFCTAALILTQGLADEAEGKGARWVRDVFILQTAWIYLAAATLKLGPSFWSGGDLFVRQNYLAATLGWPYPRVYERWIATLPFNALLAWSAVGAELALAGALVLWWGWARRRRRLRVVVIVMAVAIHGFAAAALDVFFFGASMIAQVAILTWEPLLR